MDEQTLNDDELAEAINAICAPLPEARKLRARVHATLIARTLLRLLCPGSGPPQNGNER